MALEMAVKESKESRDRSFYGTKSEIEYLTKLGTGGHKSCCMADRADLLANYLKASMMRHEWGGINIRKTLITACNMLLEEMDCMALDDPRQKEWRKLYGNVIVRYRLYS